jgi:hypothetical protein
VKIPRYSESYSLFLSSCFQFRVTVFCVFISVPLWPLFFSSMTIIRCNFTFLITNTTINFFYCRHVIIWKDISCFSGKTLGHLLSSRKRNGHKLFFRNKLFFPPSIISGTSTVLQTYGLRNLLRNGGTVQPHPISQFLNIGHMLFLPLEKTT